LPSRREGGYEEVGEAQKILEARVIDLLSMPLEELFALLGTSMEGLSSAEAERRLGIYGYNELPRRKRRSTVAEFLSHFRSPLVLILLIASAVAGFLGEVESSSIVLLIVLMSVVLDFYQEHKAGRAVEKLLERVAITATVLRDGVKREVKVSNIVPGDIILLSAGDIVPADARVIASKDLFADQSALTGESLPVEKTPLPPPSRNAPITEWRNCLFMGTSIVGGSATAVVLKTGVHTEYGEIARRLASREPETEFERGLRRFGFLMVEFTFFLVLFVFFVNTFYGRDALESLLFAVALAVGLTPELLPMILSLNLSKGAIRMSKAGVIVKRLSAIENLGNMDVLCTDKTGTLTENRIRLVLHVDVDGKEDEKVLLYSYLNSYYQTGLRNPLDEAILSYRSIDVSNYKKVDEIPFDFVRRRLTVVVEQGDEQVMITKGAPEEVVKICSFYEADGKVAVMDDEASRRVMQKYLELSMEGLRVLGVAYKKPGENKATYTVSDESDMVFLGFVAFLDPPKETAKESLQLLSKAGVEVKILTGDNELVTRRVCEQLGFEIKGIVTGSEVAQMRNDALARVVEEANVFCRLTPAQKDRILKALRDNGHIVGFLGDGINDAPSLKSADVGISVNNAVDVAKEAADVILLQHDLTVLYNGVIEGRKTFGNTLKYILMAVSSNFGNMFSVAGGSLFLPFLPMLPIQILLNNMLYDFSQTAVTTDDVDPEYVERPKRWDIVFIRNFMLFFGPISSLFDFLTFFIMLTVFGASGNPALFQTGWFLESLCTQTLIVLVIRTRRTPFYRSRPSRLLLLTTAGIVSFALALPFTPLGEIFRFVRPPPLFFPILAGIVGAYMALTDALKKSFYARYGYRLEQILVPRRIGLYVSTTTRLVQDVVAVICLYPEEEIPVDAIRHYIERTSDYPVEPLKIGYAIQYLKRSGLIDINWPQRKVKRGKTVKEYVTKHLIASDFWPRISEDWSRIMRAIRDEQGRVNPEYLEIAA